ncbi:Gfo/Idh/MocA family oxidoreductase [Cylindrospermopsis raciborskii]|nr:Gfo/Idh/MocA family oxidoreductase [Cylindrospermopsis raciborskii]MCZ2204686.1 Gfo/Idh/MocA family oxidoreductase [Cylindrospermopsis raciborskii PAMP2011]
MYNYELSTEKSIGVGLIGTGYAAKHRAQAFKQDERTNLIAIAGHSPESIAGLAKSYETQVSNSWEELVEREDVDLIVISTINSDHGKMARAALNNNKHLVVEYPLSLNLKEAEELIALAKDKKRLLHVEHIELLSSWHQVLKENLPMLGQLFYVRYSTMKAEHPARRKWTYNHQLFGFPLMGALSRLHRLIDVFGQVVTVNCHQRYWETEEEYYQGCLCTTQLCFADGLLAQVIYGKGETIWQSERKLEVSAENGGLILDGDKGIFIGSEDTRSIEIANRQGLFARDTKIVLDHIFHGSPLYVTAEQSLYTLNIADAARRAAETGLTVFLGQD